MSTRQDPANAVRTHTDLRWRNAPNSRRQILVLREGDPRPTDEWTLYNGQWKSGLYVVVEWFDKGLWDWHLWMPLLRATGSCVDHCTSPTSGAAKHNALLTLHDRPELTAAERAAVAALLSGERAQ